MVMAMAAMADTDALVGRLGATGHGGVLGQYTNLGFDLLLKQANTIHWFYHLVSLHFAFIYLVSLRLLSLSLGFLGLVSL